MGRIIVDLEFSDGSVIESSIVPSSVLSSLETNISTRQLILNNVALPSGYTLKTKTWVNTIIEDFSKTSKNSCITYYGTIGNENTLYTALELINIKNINFLDLDKSAFANAVGYTSAILDEENELGWILRIVSTNGNTFRVEAYGGNSSYYSAIHGNEPTNYNWSSVLTVYGKGKTYTLTNYLNVNNGNPVNNVSHENNIDVSAKSKVNNMIADVISTLGGILVNYSIPLANYNYIKLVYKKDAIPDNADDGTAITITQNSTSQEITGIDQNGVYWFVIFTDKSTSDPKSFKVTGF